MSILSLRQCSILPGDVTRPTICFDIRSQGHLPFQDLSEAMHQYQRIRAEIRAWTSNNILSHADQRIIHDLLAEAQHDPNNIDAEILADQTLVETLGRRRTEVVERIEQLRIGIAGHKKLPSHVLAAIFVLCHKGDTELPPCGHTSTSWSLSRVCARWRQVALAEPLLWNHLHASPKFSSSEPAMEVIHDLLSRRGGPGIMS